MHNQGMNSSAVVRKEKTMDDLISRQAALDAMGERPLTWTGGDYELGCRNQYDTDRLAIETVPSAQPGWIPCSERLPGKDESFYVLCCDKYGEIMIGNVFECYDGETPYSAESEHEYMYDCVAWMPLPKPWEGGLE